MTDAPVNSEMTDQELLEIEVKELVGLQAQSLFSPHHPDQECGIPGRSNAMTDAPIDREAVERLVADMDAALDRLGLGGTLRREAETLTALLAALDRLGPSAPIS